MSDHEAETGESDKERIDRELIELLNGLRVILPGVQVLFAFLLAVPFASRFAEADAFQRDVLLVTAVAAAVSTVLLIAPAAQHRVLFRAQAKEELLRRANRFALAGYPRPGDRDGRRAPAPPRLPLHPQPRSRRECGNHRAAVVVVADPTRDQPSPLFEELTFDVYGGGCRSS